MQLDTATIRDYLRDAELKALFIEELGWNLHRGASLSATIDDYTFQVAPIAEKRGVQVFECSADAGGAVPERLTRQKIERDVTKSAREHLIVFVSGDRTEQVWQWVARERNRPAALREQRYARRQSGDALIQKLQHIAIPLNDEEVLTLTEVVQRLAKAFDKDKVTKKFYERFKTEHGNFLKLINGIADAGDREWYASLMLNRLMFVYFIEKKGFLDGDPNYLRNRLARMRQKRKDKFHTFYRYFLLRLFHEGLGHQPPRSLELDELLGNVPYLNGGLFDLHELEEENTNIEIPDRAFEALFQFFDAYEWHLDDRELEKDNEINPDVLGYIFEKYINQKQMGPTTARKTLPSTSRRTRPSRICSTRPRRTARSHSERTARCGVSCEMTQIATSTRLCEKGLMNLSRQASRAASRMWQSVRTGIVRQALNTRFRLRLGENTSPGGSAAWRCERN